MTAPFRFHTVEGMGDYIGAHSTPWPDPLKGPWLICFHWGEVNGRAECVGIDVRSFRSKGEQLEAPTPLRGGSFQVVTTTLLRSLRADGLISESRGDYEALLEWVRDRRESGAKVRKQAAASRQKMVIPRRRGRPEKYTPDHYAEVANVYAAAYDVNRTPRRAVARHFGVHDSKAAHWIRKARQLGFLGENPGRGRAGDVTPRKRRGKSS